MKQQSYWKQRYKQRRPEWDTSLTVYGRLIARRVEPTTRILDIGCGCADFLQEVYARTPFSYGIDTDEAALAKNTAVRHPVVADAEELPFEDASFDVVALAWVMEHLRNPERVFGEIHRVLKPGGLVFFLTPNTWNYNVWLIRALPEASHDFLARKLRRRHGQDGTYPTQYRINSPRSIDRLLTSLGFERQELVLNGDPTYIALNRPLFEVACLLERLLDSSHCERAKVHIIGEYVKRVERAARDSSQ